MSADLALQTALLARLESTPALLELVPAANMLDTHERPAPKPSIILGQSQALDEGDSIDRSRFHIYHDLHIWVSEPSTEGAKRIAGAIRTAIHAAPLIVAGYACAGVHVAASRVLRDPNGETSHGIVTVEALLSEVAP